MNFRTKLLLLNCIPLLVFAAITLLFGLVQFRSSLYNETEGNLRSTALAALTLYSTQGYGDYKLRDDGHVWRGMNFNVSEKTSIVDDLKRQTGIDITFYYDDTAVMTSIEDADKVRSIGMKADENIKTYILEQGKQLWCREILINGENCQAYVIPIRQESDDAVTGALMASQSSAGFHATIRTYVMSTLLTTIVILFAVFFFIRWHVEWFAQKFSEVTDKSRQDLLTGLYNKLTFETETKNHLEKKKPENIATLLILDFDNFKHVNDNFGHQTGDEVLKAFATILLRTFRSVDIIGRVGGDEFMVFMPEMTRDNIKRSDEIAGEILSQLRELRIGKAGPFSCSIGIGACMSNCSFQELYQIADKALYEAKERGKACFVRHSSEA
ncbi:MAG: diguanylate cyclase [Selenomonadaceae bacterium]|nr:diguanylate cyclase [Selenomonadaceae bacterium]MBQ1914339.1 diguanylate cyclase [Selenomonadaceae bacterium]MBQ3972382.1 diguanylate cyclase [Selenomonadaceae bacterium]